MQIDQSSSVSSLRSRLKNNREQYGWVSIALHWLLAIALIAMYFAGDYMVDLDYYDTWYHRLPQIHKEIGVVIGGLMIVRLAWNTIQIKPNHVGDDGPAIKFMAKAAHYILYALIFVMVVSGYLISTAKGQGIDMFGFFEIPAFLPDNKDRGELAGDIHEWVGLAFMVLVALHASAALLHHFIFKDHTLKRMLKVQKLD